jgi:hypothetical protein
MIISVEKQVLIKEIQKLVHIFFCKATKGDSIRKIIQHIDERNWRTLEYFRMLDKQNQLQLNNKKVTLDMMVRNFILDFFVRYVHMYKIEIGC